MDRSRTTNPTNPILPHVQSGDPGGGVIMPVCGNCGQHVSLDYVRVFADDSGRIHGCPVCDGSPVSEVTH